METLISQVTCNINLNNSNAISLAFLRNGTGGTGEVLNFLPVMTYNTYAGDTSYAINAQTQMFLSSGQAPVVDANLLPSTMGSMNCSVSGYAGSALVAQAATPPPPAGPFPPTPAGLPQSPGLPMFTRVPAQ